MENAPMSCTKTESECVTDGSFMGIKSEIEDCINCGKTLKEEVDIFDNVKEISVCTNIADQSEYQVESSLRDVKIENGDSSHYTSESFEEERKLYEEVKVSDIYRSEHIINNFSVISDTDNIGFSVKEIKVEEESCQNVESKNVVPDITNRIKCFNKSKFMKVKENKFLHSETVWIKQGIEELNCPICKKCLTTKSILKKHIRTVHSTVKKFSCDECNKSYKGRDSLIEHQKIHEGIKKLECDICKKYCISKRTLTGHLNTHIIRFKCEECEEKFSSKLYLSTHLKAHKGTEELNCPICKKCFITKSVLKTHIITIHSTVKKFSCDECDKSYKSRNSLNQHKMIHEGIEKFECDICKKYYITKHRLKEHLHAHIIKFKCGECEKEFSNKQYFSRHLKAHKDTSKCRCPNCTKLFANQSVLKKHIMTVHSSVKKFACNECGKAFNTNWWLSEHKHLHEKVRKYMCDLCNRFFSSKTHLRQHLWLHVNKFRCKICTKHFSTKEDLVQHLKTHAGMVVKFSCEMCNKCFNTKHILKRHIQVVHGMNSFVCEECGKTYKSCWSLNYHKGTHAGNMKFQICNKSFMLKSKLRNHILTHAEKLKDKDFGEKF